MKKWFSILLTLVLVLTSCAAVFAEEKLTEFPRAETLTYNGLSWGAASSFNPLESGGNPGFGVVVVGNARLLIYETMYMYNLLTGENEPLIADGPAVVADDNMSITVKIKDNVTFNDGEACTADDIIFSFGIHNNETHEGIVTPWADIQSYVASMDKVDDHTVKFNLNPDNVNPLLVQNYFATTPILPEHIWQPRWDEHGADITTLYNEDTVATGAYRLYLADDARQVLVRVDDYWGQAENMFGKLAEPKYIMHELYQDNNAGNIAFGEGRVDVAQQFMPSVWEYQEKMVDANGDTLVHTYFDEKPYQLGWGMPSLVFNLNAPGLGDPIVRKALAMSLDYEAIATNAMSGYTNDMVMSLYNTYLFGDYVDLEDEATQDLMWDTTDLDGNIAAANALLDEAGYVDVDGDGVRELPDGSKYEWKAECPYGWSDWNASLEVLVEGAKKLGLNVVTYFPEMATFFQDYYYGTYDIAMWGITPAPSVACPWQVAFNALYSKGVTPIGEYSSRNTNRYQNDRVDELVELSMLETDPELLAEYYTEINLIWLQDLPTVPLQYRPYVWQTTYSEYWTGFAKAGDGTDTPPNILMDAAGLDELYMITSTGK